jgi:hypothetical protein
MTLSESPTVEELKTLATQHSDLEITRDDSINAGNCESGTDDFLDAFFKGRTSVKAGELVQYIEDYNGIRIVLEYKFRQLEHQAEEKSEAKPEEKQSDEEIEDEHPF